MCYVWLVKVKRLWIMRHRIAAVVFIEFGYIQYRSQEREGATEDFVWGFLQR